MSSWGLSDLSGTKIVIGQNCPDKSQLAQKLTTPKLLFLNFLATFPKIRSYFFGRSLQQIVQN